MYQDWLAYFGKLQNYSNIYITHFLTYPAPESFSLQILIGLPNKLLNFNIDIIGSVWRAKFI